MKTNKIKLTIFLLFMFSTAGFSQIGVGIGSHGFNLRTNPDARTGFIVRSGFGFTLAPWETYFKPEVAFIKRHHYSQKTKLYAGIGIAGEARFSLDKSWIGYGAIIPVGLELFPLDDQRLSLSLETGLNLIGIGFDESHFGNYGLLEITFYLHGRDYDRDREL